MTITHVLADGTQRDSMKGYYVDPKKYPKVYEVLREVLSRKDE